MWGSVRAVYPRFAVQIVMKKRAPDSTHPGGVW